MKANEEEIIDKSGDEQLGQPKTWKTWLKRLGLAGFLFFLIKGLVWIGIFAFAAKGCQG